MPGTVLSSEAKTNGSSSFLNPFAGEGTRALRAQRGLVAGQCGRVEGPWTFETDTWILILASQLGSNVTN